MLKITSPLITRTLPISGWSILHFDMNFHHELTGSQTVPAGFCTNFASIPKWFRCKYPVNDLHREECVVHDWLYHNSGYLPGIPKLTRKECDDILYSGLKKEFSNSEPLKAITMYAAVRAFGWRNWGNKIYK